MSMTKYPIERNIVALNRQNLTVQEQILTLRQIVDSLIGMVSKLEAKINGEEAEGEEETEQKKRGG